MYKLSIIAKIPARLIDKMRTILFTVVGR
jgi:hypothetical protein